MGKTPPIIRLSLLVLFLGVSCVEAPPKISPNPNSGNYTPGPPVITSGDVLGKEGVYFEFMPDFGLALGSDYTYSATSLPTWASINTASGLIFGTPTIGQTYLNIIITATNGTNTYQYGPFSIGISSDPLYAYAWYLNNTGQNTFATLNALIGSDISIKQAIEDGYTGQGIKVAVSDSGVELNHDDLTDNASISTSKDYQIQAPYYGYPVPSSPHGTAVAGILAARGWNNIGSRGVAPLATISGFQFLSSSQKESILIDQANGDYDIFNYSYGDAIFNDIKSTPGYLDQIKYQSLVGGRSGKGSIFVKASGNEFEIAREELLGVSNVVVSHNANSPLENESPYMIIVGALDSKNNKAYYSNAGSNMWISAYGGDFGVISPALITTDLPGCSDGYSRASEAYNDFEFGHSLNINCNYTSTMNGTSGATPMISGVVALMLEANPNLSSRDVKYILANTAKKVQDNYDTAHPTPDFNLTGHQYEMAWITNGAGYQFSNWFGFGVVDATAAVEMAASSSYNYLGPFIELNEDFSLGIYNRNINLAIPDNNSAGVVDTITVANNIIIESVQIEISVSHDKSGELGVELISPSGTKSILMNINNSFLLSGDKDLNKHVLTTNAFYGENSGGQWSIKVIDGLSGNTGTFTNWKINILGR